MKMNLTIGMLGLLVGLSSYADTHNLKAGQVYMGRETFNEKPTGQICYVTINQVDAFPDKGLHCHSVYFQFNSVRSDLPKEELRVDSRVTNYHRPEFPQTRTCATNINGTSSGSEIYQLDTSILYNQIFGGNQRRGSTQFDYFLTLDPVSKIATRARIHILKAFSENNVDCVNLELM